MKYKLIIFDFDGTLAHTLPWFVGVINQVAEKFKFNKVVILFGSFFISASLDFC